MILTVIIVITTLIIIFALKCRRPGQGGVGQAVGKPQIMDVTVHFPIELINVYLRSYVQNGIFGSSESKREIVWMQIELNL